MWHPVNSYLGALLGILENLMLKFMHVESAWEMEAYQGGNEV